MENNVISGASFLDALKSEESLAPITTLVEQIMAMPDEQLNEQSQDVIGGMINGAFTPQIEEQSIVGIVAHFREEGYSRKDARDEVNGVQEAFDLIVAELHPSTAKEHILRLVFDKIIYYFNQAVERYLTFDIELPIKLDPGAQMPTYAHESDAAADLASLETVVIPAHSIGNKVKTGVHLQLPDGWQARALPRSSIGAKTPLRMSNSCAVIDTAYTGDVTILFDNISDSDYTINAGDRIAQLWVEPVYRFKARKVDILQATERNEEGIGSTGK